MQDLSNFHNKEFKTLSIHAAYEVSNFLSAWVQILHLGEIYRQEFENGKRHLLYDQRDEC